MEQVNEETHSAAILKKAVHTACVGKECGRHVLVKAQTAHLSNLVSLGQFLLSWNTVPWPYLTGTTLKWLVLEELIELEYKWQSDESIRGY